MIDERLRRKCTQCGLVNYAADDTCRRCGARLPQPAPSHYATTTTVDASGTRSKVLTVLVIVAGLVFLLSRSLLLSSTPIGGAERRVVADAIDVLEHAGFSKEVFALRWLANYRSTDNWWNAYLGHPQAYASTNFPFGVVTLYPPFFDVAVDDVERAAILLHEAQHLFGAGEDAALETVWQAKARIGWTEEKYGETRVWKNTKEWTASVIKE